MIDLNKLKAAAEAAKAYQPDAIKAHSFGCFDEEGVFYELGNVCARIYERDENSDGSSADDALLNHIIAASPDAVLELIAMASAAAPQVVADERAAFEATAVELHLFGCSLARDGDVYLHSGLQACWLFWKRRAAAPVQAQEPVAYMIRENRMKNPPTESCTVPNNGWSEWAPTSKKHGDAALENGYWFQEVMPLFLAPVQPVAVPDGWKLVPVKPTEAMNDAYNGVPTGFAGTPAHSSHVWEAMLSVAPVAPAARGDALADAYQRREAYYAHTGNSTIDYDGREWGDFIGGWDAAIAAKAAS